MIEVEKNFDLKKGDKERLIEGADFCGAKKIRDIYYDTPHFDLTLADYWLRQRDGRWELKVPVKKQVGQRDVSMDRYYELEDKNEIDKELQKSFGIEFNNSLEDRSLLPFADITTTRESYKKGEFHLDFDEMNFGFTTFEIELMVKNEGEVSIAEKKITDFATARGIEATKGRGKVIEFIFRNNPHHFQQLLKANVVREGK